MNLEKIVFDSLKNGEDILEKQKDEEQSLLVKDLVHDALLYASRKDSVNLSDEEEKQIVKKIFRCIYLKNNDGEFMSLFLGDGLKNMEEENYTYYWFVWYLKDGEWEYYNYTNKESVDEFIDEDNLPYHDKWDLRYKRVVNAMLNGEEAVDEFPLLIKRAKENAGIGRDRLFTCLKYNGSIVVGLQDDCENDDVDDHADRYRWYLWDDIESKDTEYYICYQAELEGIIGQPSRFLRDCSKEKVKD